MLAEAKRWVDQGFVEGPGNNETPFGAWYHDQYEPWCDQFASYVGEASGNADVVGHFEYCPSHVDWFRQRGQWGDSPQVGALVFYSWGQNGVADHVGIVVSFDDGFINTYEGNTSSGDAGSQANGGGAYARTRPRSGLILGYGYPAYSGDSSPAPAPAPAPQSAYGPPFPGEYLRVQSPMQHDGNVETWQARMHERGWSITVDGWFGNESATVARNFQLDSSAHGWPLSADGVVGPATWSAAWNRPVS
jgi:hypothetical protein